MDCLTELAKEAVTKLGELAVEGTVRRFKYLIQHKKLTANLNEELENLKRMKQALQARVDIEIRKGHEIAPNLQKWLSDVANIENELHRFYEIEVNKNKKCLDLALNYSLGKQATEKIEEITNLKKDGKEFQTISYPKAPSRLGSTFTKDIKNLLSRNTIIAQVIEKLKDDQVKMISICGMGGVGKTTIVKQVIKIIEKTNLFDEFVIAWVSQDLNYEHIQIQIVESLGMECNKESMQGRAMQLHQRLTKSNKRVLIVLDDVWHVLDFERIGLPSWEHDKGHFCKILLTSRDKQKCQEMGSKVNFEVPLLSADEAWSLFEEMAGEVVYKPDIYERAKQVAEECRGLPLAIVTVGKALENERKVVWDDAYRQLRNSQLLDVGNKVYQSIKLSFNALDNKEHKSFLMLCGLFPEDFDIPIESLLHHAKGLGLFKAIGASWTARNRVQVLVSDLKRKFLLLDSNVSGCVKMHDIIRDVIISNSFQMQQPELRCVVLDDLKSLKEDKLNGINAISLILDDTATTLENGVQCSTLQLLQVRSKSKKLILCPQCFFQSTSVLRVFSVQNMCIPKFPCLSQASLNLQTLLLEHCDVGDISVIGKELIHLQVLSFAYSNIKKLPIEIGNLVSLRLLDLTICNDLCLISPNVLMKLTQLEELYLGIENFPWNMNEGVINELQLMCHQLKVVEIEVKGTEIVAKRLDFKNLEKFWVYVTPNTRFRRFAYLESNILQVRDIDFKSIKNMLMVSQLINRCEILAISSVKDLKSVISQLHDDKLPYLKDLRVDSCPDLEYLIDCAKHCDAFPQIQTLSMKWLDNLREICNTYDHNDVEELMNGFSELSKLELDHLPNFTSFGKTIHLNNFHQVPETSCVETELAGVSTLTMTAKLFSCDWIQKFPKLEAISIQNCPLIDLVFDMQGYSHIDGQVFPGLEEINIESLGKLTCVWSKAIHDIQGFQNLKSLKILECSFLRHVFTPAIVRTIPKFEKLEINDCQLLENLVIDYEDDGKLVALEFPSLRKLEIINCPKLDISFLLRTYKKHNNLSIPSYSNTKDIGFRNVEENYSEPSDSQFGCAPLCSKLIRQSKKNKRNNKDQTPSISETKIEVEVVCAPLLEELCVRNFDLQLGDETRVRCRPVIDENLFPKLKSLTMGSCEKISVLLSPSSSRYLACLEKLILEDCKNLKEIVSQEESEEITNKIMFPALNHLILRNLPKLKAFSQGSYELDFPSLKKVEIDHCPDMKVFSQGSSQTHKLVDVRIRIKSRVGCYTHKDINAIVQGFNALVASKESKMLSWATLGSKGILSKNFKTWIQKFDQLTVLVPFNEMEMIQHVTLLAVEYCNSLVEVFGSGGGSTIKKDRMIHYQLERMVLGRLPKLSHIWNHNTMEVVSFRKLTSIYIYSCHSLKSLISHSMARSLDQLEELEICYCDMMEEIVTKEDNYTTEGSGKKHKILFPKLKTLYLGGMPKLECVFSGYFDYDIPLCDVEEDKEMSHNNDDKVRILFPELQSFTVHNAPRFKCFCSGMYDYNIIEGSSTEECSNIASFPRKRGNVIVSTPSLQYIYFLSCKLYYYGDLNLAIHYFLNSKKYEVELQKLETLRDIEQDDPLLDYIKRSTKLNFEKCHKLLNCIPCDMMHLFQYVRELIVRECECLEEIFESNDIMVKYEPLVSLPKLVKHIPKSHPHILGLQYLRVINITQCHQLKYVFSDVSMATCVPNLYRLEVYECKKMKEIIRNPILSAHEQQHEAKIIFPNLSGVMFDNLPSLKYFYQSYSPYCVEIPYISSIRVNECPEMKAFLYNGALYTKSAYSLLVKNSGIDVTDQFKMYVPYSIV